MIELRAKTDNFTDNNNPLSHRDATLAGKLLKENNNVKMAHYHSFCLNDIIPLKTTYPQCHVERCYTL